MKPFYILSMFLLSTATLNAETQSIAPADAAATNINIVIVVLATIFAGIILFLIYLERRLARLEKKTKKTDLSPFPSLKQPNISN